MADDLDLRQFERRFRKTAQQALEEFGEIVLGEGQRRAPVKEGTLRGSGTTELVVIGDQVFSIVSFATPYAALQHEEKDFQHPAGGEAKYLENAVKQLAPKWEPYLAARLGRLF